MSIIICQFDIVIITSVVGLVAAKTVNETGPANGADFDVVAVQAVVLDAVEVS